MLIRLFWQTKLFTVNQSQSPVCKTVRKTFIATSMVRLILPQFPQTNSLVQTVIMSLDRHLFTDAIRMDAIREKYPYFVKSKSLSSCSCSLYYIGTLKSVIPIFSYLLLTALIMQQYLQQGQAETHQNNIFG